MNLGTKILGSLVALAGLSGCASIDCPLDSVVVWTLTFYDSTTGSSTKLPQTLTVRSTGPEPLFNKGTNLASLPLPMSYGGDVDTLYLHWLDGTTRWVDTLYVAHTNEPHFEAIDCPASVFHTITDVEHHPTSFEAPIVIDSLRLIRPQVDYSDVENLRLHLHTRP